MTVALIISLTICGLTLVIYHMHVRKIMYALDEMLAEAIRGDFEVERFDETQLSRIEAKLSRFLGVSKMKRGQIESEQEKIRSLINDISHQTKTPIANILLYAQLLCEHDLPEDAKPLAAQVSAGADKLSFLIQTLVKASRLESGIIKITPQGMHPQSP